MNGDLFTNRRNVDGVPQIFYHDFRYGYLTGEVGVIRNLSANFVLTYLDGIEGATAEPYKNRGLSDAWFGAKYHFRRGELPMAFALDFRTGVFYDLPGPYNRYLYNADGSIRGNSPEWRDNFNEASTGRIGAGFIIPFGRNSRWGLEAGYNAWIWGRSARRYREPYVSIFRSF